MPGVPSSRGCDACRKQKKKCDQGKPSCARCTRLGIACIGAGRVRWQFKEQVFAAGSGSGSGSGRTILEPATSFTLSSTSAVPWNLSAGMTGAFISILEVPDIRYDLRCYGDFLEDIPRRLATNNAAALNASVRALTLVHASICTHQQTPEMLAGYISALKAVRTSLDDPVESQSLDTLCAIYLIMLCQIWIGKTDGPLPSHGEAIAHILAAKTSRGLRGDEHEMKVLTTLCMLVIVESLLNFNINPDVWLPGIIQACNDSNMERFQNVGIEIQAMARLARLIRDPAPHFHQVRTTYRTMYSALPQLRQSMAAAAASLTPASSPSRRARRAYVLAHAQVGALLAFTMVLNGMLRVFCPGDRGLSADALALCDEIIAMAEQSYHMRPLGATHVPVALVAAWAGMDDAGRLLRLDELIMDYQRDQRLTPWMGLAMLLKGKYDLLKLELQESHDLVGSSRSDGFIEWDWTTESDTTT